MSKAVLGYLAMAALWGPAAYPPYNTAAEARCQDEHGITPRAETDTCRVYVSGTFQVKSHFSYTKNFSL